MITERTRGAELSDRELSAIFELCRKQERSEIGENLSFGPGYGRCLADYAQQTRSQDGGRLLGALSNHLGLQANLIVPVMAGSCSLDGYLNQVVEGARIIPISSDLDLVVFDNAEQAKIFRAKGEMVLPLHSTQEVIKTLEDDGDLPSHERSEDFESEGIKNRDEVKQMIIERFGLPESTTIHLGGEGALQAIFKSLSQKDGSSVVFPVPNYFDAMLFAKQNNFRILPMEKFDRENLALTVSASNPDMVYISNPNNPTGKLMNLEELSALLEVLPVNVKVVIDEVNMSLENSSQFMSTPWKELFGRFPDHHIIVVDSLSKSHDLVADRVGFAVASHQEDQEILAGNQPPRLAAGAKDRVEKAINSSVESATIATIKLFHNKLKGISENSVGKISVSSDSSNFCVVHFSDKELKNKFFEEIEKIDPVQISTKQFVGKPQSGAGEIGSGDLNPDGSLKVGLIGKVGILGLSENAVRLSALCHPIILDALAYSLA